MGPWVQDALDAIEYANGPVDSQWGALPANTATPRRFNLKYIEIGNENGGPVYQERYRLFYDAIKAKYPEITLVADVRTDQRPIEIVDEHYYSSPEFFIGQASKYDKYDRSGPKVYVGEYAVTQGCGQGNLRAALGEAAFMTGMERNSDVVVMASYAPLFVNVGWRQWNPDAIDFDSCAGLRDAFVPRAGHVRRHRGDAVLPVELTCPAAERAAQRRHRRRRHLGHAGRVQGHQGHPRRPSPVPGDFDQGPRAGGSSAASGKSRTACCGRPAARPTAAPWPAASVDGLHADAESPQAGRGGGLPDPVPRPRPRAKSWWNIGGWGNDHHAIEMPAVVGDQVSGRIETDRWYDIRIELKGPNIRCYLDGKLIHDITYPSFQSLYAVASRIDKTGEVILKVVNVSAQSHATEIRLRGVAQVADVRGRRGPYLHQPR